MSTTRGSAGVKFFVLWFAALFLVFGAFSQVTPAQQPKVLAPHKPVAPKLLQPRMPQEPAVPRMLTGGLWMIDPNLKSSIYLSNNLETSPLTVTPVLWLSNGVRYALPAVALQPSGTAIVDINNGLAAQGIAPYASLSGYVELDYSWAWDALCATVWNVDTLHSVIFTYSPQLAAETASLGHSGPPNQTQTLEGLWWKEEANVAAFVALSNPGTQVVTASVTVNDRLGNPIEHHNEAVSPHGTKTLTLAELPTAAGATGGIQVTYGGAENALLVSGGLRDDASGYSANIPFVSPPASGGASSTVSYAELGLMAGAADPMLSFPSGTVFIPYAVARNISSQPVAITPNLYWMKGGAAQAGHLSAITLAPYETRALDVMSLLAQAGQKSYIGDLSLVLDVTSNVPRGAVLIAAGSVDRKNTYVFQVVPQAIRESVAKTLSYWSTANGNDTMVTLWNPADEPQDFNFTLSFAGGHYASPIHLEPRATLMFNISELLRSTAPDAEGNVIPAGVQEGRARIAGSLGNSQHILVAMDAGTYNVQKATCGSNCHNCDGIVSSAITDNPFTVAVGSTHQLAFIETDNYGAQYDATSISSWSSSNPSVATVSTGLVNGVAPGSVTVLANDSDSSDFFRNCTSQYLDCPVTVGAGGSAQGNTTPTVSFLGTNNFIFLGNDPTVTPFNVQYVQGNPNAGTYSWNGSSSSSYHPNISFNGSPSPYSTAAAQVTVTADASSTSLLDTTLTVSYSVSSQSAQATRPITIRIFRFLQQSGNIQIIPINNSSPPRYGYTSYVYYNVITNPGGQLLQPGYSNISVYETVSQPNSNFPVTEVTGTGGTSSNSQVVDTLSIYGSSPLPSNFSASADQYLGVGGIIVRHNTLSWSQAGPNITNLGPFN